MLCFPSSTQRSQKMCALIKNNFYVIVSKKLPRGQEVIDAFNKGLRILRENGRYKALKEEFNWME